MKKKFGILLAIMLMVSCLTALFTITAFAEEAQETITISYMNTQETTSDTTSLDKTAYTDGKQIVGKGEKFTLPTTSSSSYTGQDGFQLVWYTENGRTYKAGETVSFDEDTKLFRCVAKECYSLSEVNSAMKTESKAAILMSDINATSGISVENQGQSVLILNGYDITITMNSSNFMGDQRSGKHIYGAGTINAVNPDGKVGNYYFFEDKSHGYNGSTNKTVIGVDVTINAPNMWLGSDGDGSYNNHYPWTRIYGTVNCYGLVTISNLGNRAPFVEIFDGATVTINGPTLFKDNVWRANGKYSFNSQSFELRIYGGTFYLPAEAATEAFWTNDNAEDYVNGSNYYYNYGLTKNTQDIIKIFGGSFYLPDNAIPAISAYLTADWIGSIPSGGNGLYANKDTSTYYVCYMNRPGYKLAFEKYTIGEGAYGKLTVTDYIDGSLSGTYYYQMENGTITFVDPYNSSEVTQNTISEIKVYEMKEITGEDGSTVKEYTITDKFELSFGMNGAVLFSNSIIKADQKLQAVQVNNTVYQVAVPSDCEHTYVQKSANAATCINLATVLYECSACGDSFTASFGERAEHDMKLISDIPASTTSAGLKTYECDMCNKIVLQSYTFDPTDLTVNVVVSTDEGEKTVQARVSDVLNLTSEENDGVTVYTLIGVKDFDEYFAKDIISIEVPIGVSYINLEANSTLQTLVLADYANTTIVSFAKTSITKIYIGAATVLFQNGCSNNVIQGIYSDVSGANVTFDEKVFSGKKTITELTYSAGSTYAFSTNSFREVQVKELIFPDYCTVTFGGEAAFYNCAVEYLYIGLGNPTLAGKPFDYCQKMQKIVLMDVNKITGDYTFCVENGGEKPVEVYIHSETMSLTSNTFYQCHGIIVYTNAPLTTGFNSCSAKTYGDVSYPAYTIYYGIGHKYTEGISEPTCTADGSTGYVTDCPCGKVDENKEYKKFTAKLTNSDTYETGIITTTVIPALGHSQESAIVDVVYADYFANARATYLCPTCEAEYFEELENSALFTERGYSASEDDKSVISYTVFVNKAAIDAYAPFASGDIKYGLILSAVTDSAPILGLENGKIKNIDGSIVVEFSETSYTLLQMKLYGIEDIKFVACGFMMEGDRAFYLGQNTSSSAYEVISHAIVLEMIPKQEDSSDETIPE